jgi:hypothetical protein
MKLADLVTALFDAAAEPRAGGLRAAWLGGLFLAGLVAWAYFFAFGRTPLNFHDWAEITVPRLAFVQRAWQDGELPLHMLRSAALHGATERFLAIPDVITTPQTALLLVVPLPVFIIIDVLINFTIGFAGLLLLRRHFQWSLFTFAVVFLMVLFNGHILAHYSAGHFTWGPYFLFPIIFLRLFRFLDGDDSWRSVAAFAFTAFYMVLAGGQHHLTWILIMLAALLPVCWPRVRWLLAAASASVLLSAIRLAPPALELGSFREAGFITDVLGYPSVHHLLQSLVTLRRELPVAQGTLPGNLWFFDHNYWEFNVYIGVIGTTILALGIYHWLRGESPRYHQLVVPMLVLVALSMGSVFRLARLTGIPLLEGERITSRMFSLALVMGIIMAAAVLDRKLRQVWTTIRHRMVALAVLIFLVIDVAASLRLQRVAVSSGVFGASPYSPSAAAHYADPVYAGVLVAALAITVGTGATLIALAARERRSLGR